MTSSLPTYPAPKADPATPAGLLYTHLRAAEPVSRVVMPSGHSAWLVTRYDDVRAVLSDPRFSRYLLCPGAPYMIEPGDFSTGERSILNLDPPDHTRLRRLAAKAFTARRIEGMRGRVAEIAEQLLDAISTRTPPVDLIEEFAFPLPTAVTCEPLGVPFEDRASFRVWSTTIVTPLQHGPEAVAAAMRECARFMSELIERKRHDPGTDLLTALIEARDEDDRLTEPELVDLMTQLLLAGHETTVNLIASAVVLLARHPDQLAAVRADPALVRSAVEEVLRYESPAEATLLRVATADVSVGGVTIRKGEGVLAHTGSANFDEARFANPTAFDITRRDNPHLGFGHGAHFCFGAPLARLEAQVALTSLLRRFPDPAARGQPRPGPVPVTW